MSAILRFYVVLYLLRLIFKDKIHWLFNALCAVAVGMWFYLSRQQYVNVYEAASKYAWFVYFLVMLAGFCLGQRTDRTKERSTGFWTVGCIALTGIYYGLLALARHTGHTVLDLVSTLPLFVLMYALFKLFDGKTFRTAWNRKWCWPFRFVSTHCWEIYLAQLFFVFTYNNHFDRVFPFPSNIPMTFLAIFATAYVIKMLSRLIVQLFNKGDFDWGNIVKTWI